MDDEKEWERRNGRESSTHLPFWPDGSPELATAATLVDWLCQEALSRPPETIFCVKNFTLLTQCVEQLEVEDKKVWLRD
jgi:hypothetical protein